MTRTRFVGASLAAGVTAGALVVLLEELFSDFWHSGRPDLLALLVPSLALLIVAAAIVVATAILGRAASAEARVVGKGRRPLDQTVHLMDSRDRDVPLSAGSLLCRQRHGGRDHARMVGPGRIRVARRGHVVSRQEAARQNWLVGCASVASTLFFAGLLGTIGLAISVFANMPSLMAPGGDDSSPFDYYIHGINGTSIPTLTLLAVSFGSIGTP